MGCDGIPPSVLQYAAAALYLPIHHLSSLCIANSYIPLEWRCHIIIPIPKSSGDLQSIPNYHPISLLCTRSKVLEHLVCDNVSGFVIDNVISSSQFGFVKNRSSLQQLLVFMDYIIKAHEEKVQVDVVYLDIKKAFDILFHIVNFCLNFGYLALL